MQRLHGRTVRGRAGAAFLVLGVLAATRTSTGSRLLRDWRVEIRGLRRLMA